MNQPQTPISSDKRATEYLANERTFLAWIRTSIAIISLGFVVSKFSLWLNQLESHLNASAPSKQIGASMPLGVSMMVMGGVIAGLAAWRYHVVNSDIEKGRVQADRALIILITFMVILLSIAMITYMLFTVHQS